MTTEHECEFCQEFRSGVCEHLSGSTRRILYEDQDFVVLPALGAFVEGYLLLCSRAHEPSIASLDSERLRRFELLLGFVERVLAQEYSRPWIFEHGMTAGSGSAGGCIDHAHLHLLPGNLRLEECIRGLGNVEELRDWSALGRWRDRPYILLRGPETKPMICEAPSGLPSQFLRRHAAESLGIGDEWNWAINSHESNIMLTKARLRHRFPASGQFSYPKLG